MGKGKSQKKKTSLPSSAATTTDTNTQKASRISPGTAMDGHNVEGWTHSQIKAYNELLLERAKLENQRKQLEQRSAVSQAGRALLNQNVFDIDTAFQLLSTGNYKFIGQYKCCVDVDSTADCHHEICSRSKIEGISLVEMDTIKYYHMRICTEKSQRKQQALCKQRDIELTKLSNGIDHSIERVTRKAKLNDNSTALAIPSSNSLSKATKETQRLVTSILDQLESLRSELQTGQISGSEMQKQLDIIDAEMHAAHLQTSKFEITTSSEGDHGVGAAKGTKISPSSDLASNGKAESYNKAFGIMENFLSASKPGDFQLAITELKEALRLNGPMGEDLQNFFNALEGVFDNPDRLSFAGPDGKQQCTSIIDLMEKMKETLKQTGNLPEGANAELTKVFEECIALETRGSAALLEHFTRRNPADARVDLAESLFRVRADIVSKSPIPPLTEKTLGDEINMLLEKFDVLDLINRAEEGESSVVLEGYITSMVMSIAKRDPEKYVQTIQRLALMYENVRDQDRYPILEEAFPKLEAKMNSFVAKLADKQRELETISKSNMPSPPKDSGGSDATDLLSDFPMDTAEVVSNAIKKMAEHDRQSDVHLSLRVIIAEHGSGGLWPLWLLFAEETNFAENHAIQEKAQRFEHEIDSIMSDRSGGLRNAIVYLYGAGACPGLCAAIISEMLASLSEVDQHGTQQFVAELGRCVSDLPVVVDDRWRSTFSHVALAMVQLYVALYINVMVRFPHLQPEEFSLSTVAMVTTYVCLMDSSQLASENLKLICVFLNVCMSSDGVEPVREIIEASKHYETFSNDKRYRCTTPDPCLHHFPTTTLLKDKSAEVVRSSSSKSTVSAREPHFKNGPSLRHGDDSDSAQTKSRFSELIEDRQFDLAQTQDRERVKDVDRRGTLPPRTGRLDSTLSIEQFAQAAKQNALSGKFSNPVAIFTKGMASILKEPGASQELRDILVRTQHDIKTLMKQPRVHSAWTTRRLKFLLSLGGPSTIPNCQALYNLATRDFSMFEEYAALLASGMTNAINIVNQVKILCDEVCDLLGDARLQIDSPCIQDFSKIALREWAKRETGTGSHSHSNATAKQPNQSHHREIMSRLEQFCKDLQDLEATRDKIESLTTPPNARKHQVKVFDDLVGELNHTKGVIMDVASIVAKTRKSTELESFISRNMG